MNNLILSDVSMGFGVGMGVWFVSYWTSRAFAFVKFLSN